MQVHFFSSASLVQSIRRGESIWVLSTAEVNRYLITNARAFWTSTPDINAAVTVCWGLVSQGTMALDAPADFTAKVSSALTMLADSIEAYMYQKKRDEHKPQDEYSWLMELEKILPVRRAEEEGMAVIIGVE